MKLWILKRESSFTAREVQVAASEWWQILHCSTLLESAVSLWPMRSKRFCCNLPNFG